METIEMLLQAAIITLSQQCAPFVESSTMAALVVSESSGNPYAIGIAGAQLDKQPASAEEAIEVAKSLLAKGANISVGLGQINHNNFAQFGLTIETAFDQCKNIAASGQILSNCYNRASTEKGEGQEALKAAFSCYYSNNFTRGFVTEDNNKPSYVKKIAVNNAKLKNVPEILFSANEVKEVQPAQKNPIEIKDVKALEDVGNNVSNKKRNDDVMSWDVLNDFKN